MNAERLHAIAIAVKQELQGPNIPKLVSQMVDQLQNVVNQPQQPQHQQQLGSTRSALARHLTDSASNEFSPAWVQAIEELGIRSSLGNPLLERIENVFVGNELTPQLALEAAQVILTDVQGALKATEQLISGFTQLGVGHEVLEPGEGEVGILLPRSFVHNRFDYLAKEFKELNSILSVLAEVGTGTSEPLEIRTLSTTDPFIVLGASLGVLSTIAMAVKPIISAYKEILEVRLLHAQLAEKKISAERLRGVEEHAEEIMGKAIESVKSALLESYPSEDIGRRNELNNALGPALSKLANRIDRGFNVEIRVEPLTDVSEEDEEGENTENEEKAQQIEAIRAAVSEMEFMNLTGQPILHLPETTSNDESANK